MRSWLGFFVTVHHHFFVNRARIYLKSKGLKLDEWMESIKMGRRGDILVLYRLYLLMDSHCTVHLNRNHLWSSLDYIPDGHTVLIEHCEIHLYYAGNGIFVQLVPREIPVPATPNDSIKMEVLGTLTADECSTLLKEWLSKPKHDDTKTEKLPPIATASAGSPADLPQVEIELNRPITRSYTRNMAPEKITQDLKVILTPLSESEISCFTSTNTVDTLISTAYETSSEGCGPMENNSQDQDLDETTIPELDCVLDLSRYGTNDQYEPEIPTDSSKVLDLSGKDASMEEHMDPVSSLKPYRVNPVKTSSPTSTKTGV